jgi:hypothetical protein
MPDIPIPVGSVNLTGLSPDPEVLTDTHLTQFGVENLETVAAPTDLTQLGVESLEVEAVPFDVTQFGVESLEPWIIDAHLSQFGVEFLHEPPVTILRIVAEYSGTAAYRPGRGEGTMTIYGTAAAVYLVPVGAFVFSQDGAWLFVRRDGTELSDPPNTPNASGRDPYRGGLMSLPTGEYCEAVRTANQVSVFDTDLAALGSTSITPTGIGTNHADAFFAKTGTIDLKKFSAAGVVVQTWTGILPSATSSIGVAPDESFVYFTSGAATLRKYDLQGAGGMTTVATETGNFAESGGMAVATLQDGRILAAFVDGTTNQNYVGIWESDGSLVRRDNFGAAVSADFIMAIQAGLDELSYLVWWYDDANTQMVMTEVVTSTGAQTDLFTKPASGGTIDWDNAMFALVRVGIL